ncbi:MAG: peptide deformylase [Acholeplasmataceae bacterium]
MRNIIVDGHPNLLKVSNPVKMPLSFADKRLARELHEFVVNSQDKVIREKYNLRAAVGLAAPQVNILKRMFAVHFDFAGEWYSHVVINPVITYRSEELIYLPGGEGCLSVDYETEGLTPRYRDIEIEFMDFDPKTNKVMPNKLSLTGYPAIVFQHEFDHLEGILFVSKLYDKLENAEPAFEIVHDEDL